MPLYNWVGAEYALYTNLFRIWKGKSCGAKRQCSIIRSSEYIIDTKQSQATWKSSAALVNLCILLPRL